MTKKERSLLSNMMYATKELEYKDSKRKGIAGESNEEARGEAKSFPFIIQKSTPHRDGLNEESYQELMKFFEDLNDVRFYVWQDIEKKLGKLEQLDEQSIIQFLSPNLKEKKKPTSTEQTNAWTKTIRELTVKVVKRNSPRFDHLNEGKLPYWISYDLHPKISSYLAILKKAGGDSKKDLFDTWSTPEDQTFDVDLDTFNAVTKANLKSWNEKKAKEVLVSLASKNTKNKYFEYDATGKIKKLQGHTGVKEHNIFVRQLNILLGSYLGQLSSKAVQRFSQETGEKFKTKRDVFTYLKKKDDPKLTQKWNESYPRGIRTLQEIKKYPSPPSFYLTSSYKERQTEVDLAPVKVRLAELLQAIRKFPLSKDRFADKVLRTSPSATTQELQEMLIELKSREQSNQMLAHRKRILRHLIYLKGLDDFTAAQKSEVQYLEKKVQNLATRSKRTPRKIKLLSSHIQKLLRLELNSRELKTSNLAFELDMDIKKLCGDLQMSTLKTKPYRQFSFQFRQYEQSGLYPSILKIAGKSKFHLSINLSGNDEKLPEKIPHFELKDGGKIQNKKIQLKTGTRTYPIHFGSRIGRKFFFNQHLGFTEKNLTENTPMNTKLGTPNFYLRFLKNGDTEIRGAFAFTKQRYANNLLNYSSTVAKSDISKSKFILDNIKYLIGIDRGENKLLCLSVYDLSSMSLVKQITLGEGFKTTIDQLKAEQAQARSSFKSPSAIKRIDKKISGKMKAFVDDTMATLTKWAIHYQQEAGKDKQYAALVFEHISGEFRRQGNRAYMELNQMHKMITTIRDNRNFYELGFHIFDIGPSHTSQICKMCGVIDPRSRQGEEFKCTACGHTEDADMQASENILIKWLAYKSYVLNKMEKKANKKEYWQEFTRKIHKSAA